MMLHTNAIILFLASLNGSALSRIESLVDQICAKTLSLTSSTSTRPAENRQGLQLSMNSREDFERRDRQWQQWKPKFLAIGISKAELDAYEENIHVYVNELVQWEVAQDPTPKLIHRWRSKSSSCISEDCWHSTHKIVSLGCSANKIRFHEMRSGYSGVSVTTHPAQGRYFGRAVTFLGVTLRYINAATQPIKNGQLSVSFAGV